jgi:AcrR family transcriptional regulator
MANTARGRILHAAVQAVYLEGAAGLRVDIVAAHAGVNKRMIYHYFGSRDGLIGAVVFHALARLCEFPEIHPGTRALCLQVLAEWHDPASGAEIDASAHEAMVIALPALRRHLSARGPYQVTHEEWGGLAQDVTRLLLPQIEISEYLLSQEAGKKPVFRLHSTSRRVGPRAPGVR